MGRTGTSVSRWLRFRRPLSAALVPVLVCGALLAPVNAPAPLDGLFGAQPLCAQDEDCDQIAEACGACAAAVLRCIGGSIWACMSVGRACQGCVDSIECWPGG